MPTLWSSICFTSSVAAFALVLAQGAASQTYWRTSGGTGVVLTEDGTQVEVRVVEVSPVGAQLGISPGTILFRGRRGGEKYTGVGVSVPSRGCQLSHGWEMQIDGEYLLIRIDTASVVRAGTCYGPQYVQGPSKWKRDSGRVVRKPDIKSVEIGRPVEIGRSVDIGRSVPIGKSAEIGRPTDVGKPVDVGRSTSIGKSVSVGSSAPIGSSVPIGNSVNIGNSVPIGTGVDVGKSTAVGTSATIAESVELGRPVETGRSVPVGTSQPVGVPATVGTSTEIGASTEIGKSVRTAEGKDIATSTTVATLGKGPSLGPGSGNSRSQSSTAPERVPQHFDRGGTATSLSQTDARSPATQVALRQKLWPVMGVPGSMEAIAINKEKITYDWGAIQLARAAYSDKLKIGGTVFENDPNWVVADKHVERSSGLLAYTFVNEKEHRVVVGIQGSRNPMAIVTPGPQGDDVIRDWSGDAQAIVGGYVPQQFSDAQKYIATIKTRYGKDYAVDCAGHSMGGGACAYAASQTPGVHGIAIDPISSGSISTKNAYQIDNYFLPGEGAGVANRFFERGGTGWQYRISDPPGAMAAPSGVAGTTPSTIPNTGGIVARHSMDRAIEYLGREAGLVPYRFAQ